ncbi:MAG: hypothetical protein LBG81_05570 [Coriobacteriaceae bacterium]|jgi:hypothetical protein|nr:hypothetical protein [Coriobacteriaceae bacterium]
MAERIVENNETEVPEIPEILESVMLYALEEAKEKINQGADLIPFTVLVVKDNLFLENHPGDSAEECFAFAKHTVEGARGADAYAFCYDGYVETDAGTQDTIIAEGGIPGEPDGMAIGYLYTLEDGSYVFDKEPAYIGEAPNFMAGLKSADAYGEDEIDPQYTEEEYPE